MPQGLLGGLLMGMGQAKKDQLAREREKELMGLKKQLINVQLSNAKIKQQEQDMKNKILQHLINKDQQDNQTSGTTPAPKTEGADKSKLIESMAMTPEEMALFKWAGGPDLVGAGRFDEQMRHNQQLESQANQRIEMMRKNYNLKASEVVPVVVPNPDGSQTTLMLPKFKRQGMSIKTKLGTQDIPIPPADAPLYRNPKTGESATIGMTPREAMAKGMKKTTTGQLDSFKSFQSAEAIIGEVEMLMSKVFPKTESLMGRAFGAPKRQLGAMLQTDENAAKLYGFIQGTLAPVVRSMGEKGNLSDTDMKRAMNLFPKLTDDADVAWGKINQLKNLITTLKQKAIGGTSDTPTIKSKAEYDKLPIGSEYIWNNIRYTKSK